MISPISCATVRIEKVGNVAINIELVDGCVGWGEAPVLFFIIAEGSAVGYVKGCGSM